MTGLYDADVLEWSEHETALLRRLAAGPAQDTAGIDFMVPVAAFYRTA